MASNKLISLTDSNFKNLQRESNATELINGLIASHYFKIENKPVMDIAHKEQRDKEKRENRLMFTEGYITAMRQGLSIEMIRILRDEWVNGWDDNGFTNLNDFLEARGCEIKR